MPKQPDYNTLIRALAQTTEDTLTCAACEAQLADYVYALAAHGEQVVTQAAEWQALIQHLAGCPHCAAQVAELRAMVDSFYTDAAAVALNPDLLRTEVGELPDQASAGAPRPQPDLAFLHTPGAPPARGWWQAAGELWIAFSAQLLAPLQPGFPLQTAPSGLKADNADQAVTTAQQAETIDEANPQAIATVTIAVHYPAAPHNREQCTVEVAITIPTRAPLRLNGIAVHLQSATATLATQWTDAFGRVLFTEVPVAQLPQLYCVIGAPEQA
jgi:anti-sigma factor RsiW